MHTYRNLAETGEVPFLVCPDDYNKLVTVMGPHDEPALWCSECDTTLIPGLNIYERIESVLNAQNNQRN